MPNMLCHGCGIYFAPSTGSGLYHSAACEAQYTEIRNGLKDQLAAAGFTQDPNTPNLWTKSGVSISFEQIVDNGFDATIAEHDVVVASLG